MSKSKILSGHARMVVEVIIKMLKRERNRETGLKLAGTIDLRNLLVRKLQRQSCNGIFQILKLATTDNREYVWGTLKSPC